MSDVTGEIITRKRGDTAPDKITVIDSESATSAPLDNTGFQYKLTVNTEKDPEPVGPPIVGNELFSLTGAVGGADGTVVFPITVGDADQEPGRYWYDIQQTDTAGKIKTIAKNEYVFEMDVTK